MTCQIQPGKIFTTTSFGTSHGKAIGAIVDGCPANLELSEEDIQKRIKQKKTWNK
ncbi:MAG: chorismate synthase [Methanobrevibacter boviskoreani]|uniref:chorismate synthase n=1 Tax=Methanobrevibacter boviskoreani TaxID=1348249 RepID=UPI003D8F21EF